MSPSVGCITTSAHCGEGSVGVVQELVWLPESVPNFAGTAALTKRYSAFQQSCVGVIAMKTLLSSLALALALGFAMPAFAGDVTTAKNAADCEKAGGAWDAAKNVCSEKKM